MTLGEKVRAARERLKLTQEGLASQVGASPSFITRVERDQALPGDELLLALATVLVLDSGELKRLAEQAKRERQDVRVRTRGAAVGRPIEPRDEPQELAQQEPKPTPESLAALAAQIFADEDLKIAFAHLRIVLADPALKATVMKLLEVFSQQARLVPKDSPRPTR
jgi:transcriptional regulator with XRE-family HTH domain